MRYLIFIAIFLISCTSQKRVVSTGYVSASGMQAHVVDGKKRYDVRKAILPASLAMVSGAAWGFHETSVHHADRIPDSWNQQYWDGRISWRNKYKDGNPDLGPRFPGSTTVLAWTTDAKHLFGTAHRATLFASGVTITIGERRPVWHYLADVGISFAAFSIGFHSVYTVGF